MSTPSMEAAENAAAMAGWSMNPRAPIEQRLVAGKQALDFYIDRIGKLDDLVIALRVDAGTPPVTVEISATYLDAALRIEKILDGTVPMDEDPAR